MRKAQQTGFTLLEVIVAMALTGIILGSLFTLVAGSKKLSWRSEASLVHAMKLRAAANFALLQDGYSDVEPILEDDEFRIHAMNILEPPLRKTQASIYTLESFEVAYPEIDEVVTGTRWVRLELPE